MVDKLIPVHQQDVHWLSAGCSVVSVDILLKENI